MTTFYAKMNQEGVVSEFYLEKVDGSVEISCYAIKKIDRLTDRKKKLLYGVRLHTGDNNESIVDVYPSNGEAYEALKTTYKNSGENKYTLVEITVNISLLPKGMKGKWAIIQNQGDYTGLPQEKFIIAICGTEEDAINTVSSEKRMGITEYWDYGECTQDPLFLYRVLGYSVEMIESEDFFEGKLNTTGHKNIRLGRSLLY